METAATAAAPTTAASAASYGQRQQQQIGAGRRLPTSPSRHPPAATAGPTLDVVRALHQTVISLRTALDSSREELRRLKESTTNGIRSSSSSSTYPGEKKYGEAVERLAIENHVLRSRLYGHAVAAGKFSSDAATSPPSSLLDIHSQRSLPKSERSKKMESDTTEPQPQRQPDDETATTPQDEAAASGNANNSTNEEDGAEAAGATAESNEPQQQQQQTNKLSCQGASNESENESEELDDIELIFTTEETHRDVGLQEDLVSITDTEHWQQQQRTPTPIEPSKSILKISQAKSADQVDSLSTSSAASTTAAPALSCNGATIGTMTEKSGSVEEAASSQGSSIDREESVDRFDESSGSRLNKMWSQCSVLVETDISKCGVLEEMDLQARNAHRRNTLAAPPAAYRPIIHREALAGGRRKSAAPLRPLMDRSGGVGPTASSNNGGGGGGGARRESGAQTDISALPAQWRSESYLAHKVAHTFTTLPSKFALPSGTPSGRLRLSDKTREARRVMLSDISFTSMVPELSRSADHLCQEPHNQFPQAHCYNSRTGVADAQCSTGLRTPESNRRDLSWGCRSGAASGLPSPCECRLPGGRYYRGSSLTSIASPAGEFGPSRRHSWRPNATASFDGWRAPAVLPGSQTCNAVAAMSQLARPTWSSMPSSPTHVQPPSAALVARLTGNPPRRTRSKVTFQECPMIRGSLPNLRSESLGETSGDSTESLLDEAEDYLRRSIDSMLTITSPHGVSSQQHQHSSSSSSRRRRARRHSEPDLLREWRPPQDARPYLPKIPRDLKLDHLVKVISPEGRILQGRVRYVGPVAGRDEVHVGVLLPTESGNSDGTFHGRRYFDCEPERAVFVPFKKVVLAWCTT